MTARNEMPYSEYYVAFLDVLGFKDLVKSAAPGDKERIYEYFSLVKEITRDLQQIESKKNIGSIIISDSVILSVPMEFDKEDKINKLRQLCIAIQKIQFRLAEKNIWLRGAISSGEAFFSSSDSQVVGPAYINAYLLEKRHAIHPRVILDNKIINKLGLDSSDTLIEKVNNNPDCSEEYYAEERNVLFQWMHGGNQKIGLSKDVALFVDYLAYAFTDNTKLKAIVDNIEERIYIDNAIYSKFRWVADYLVASCIHHNNNVPCAFSKNFIMEQCRRLQKL